MLTENWKTSKIIFLPLFITVKFEPKMQIRNLRQKNLSTRHYIILRFTRLFVNSKKVNIVAVSIENGGWEFPFHWFRIELTHRVRVTRYLVLTFFRLDRWVEGLKTLEAIKARRKNVKFIHRTGKRSETRYRTLKRYTSL